MEHDWTQLLRRLQAGLGTQSRSSQQPRQPSQPEGPTLWKKPISGKVVRISIGKARTYNESVQEFETLRGKISDYDFLYIGRNRNKFLVAITVKEGIYILFDVTNNTIPSAFGMWMIHAEPKLAQYVYTQMRNGLFAFFTRFTDPQRSELYKFALMSKDRTIVQDKDVTFEQLTLNEAYNVKSRDKVQLWELLNWEHLILRNLQLSNRSNNLVFKAILVSDDNDLLNRNALLVEETPGIVFSTTSKSNDRLKTFILSFLRTGISSELTAEQFETWLNTALRSS
jgi:hypothetical protein